MKALSIALLLLAAGSAFPQGPLQPQGVRIEVTSSPSVTEWGKPENGLQAGVRSSKEKLKPGEEVGLEFVIRNVSSKPVDFSHWPGGQYWGEKENGTVKVGVMHISAGPVQGPTKTTILPGKEIILGRLVIGSVVPSKERAFATAGRMELPVGKYQVGAGKLADALGRNLGTGYLDLEVETGQEKKEPKKTPPHFKVDVRGELRITERGEEIQSGALMQALGKQKVYANVVVHSIRMGLIFGENKELAVLAQKLDGKTVVITGHLLRFSPDTAGPPTQFFNYIQVTSLKAAE